MMKDCLGVICEDAYGSRDSKPQNLSFVRFFGSPLPAKQKCCKVQTVAVATTHSTRVAKH